MIAHYRHYSCIDFPSHAVDFTIKTLLFQETSAEPDKKEAAAPAQEEEEDDDGDDVDIDDI